MLVFALWTGCGDDEGTKKTEEEKKKEEKKKEEKKKEDKKKEEAKKKADDKKKMAITEAEIKKTKAYKDLDKQLKDKAKELIALQTKRKPAKTYLWAAAAAVAGNWGDPSRTMMDNYCSGARAATSPAVLGQGRPAIITDDNADYVTKALALGHAINNFEELGAAALTAGAHKDSLSDPVYGLSSSGFSETILADDYEKFRTEAWKTNLLNARVGAAGAIFWIGAHEDGENNAGTKHAANFHCQNFTSAANPTGGGTANVDEGTTITVTAINTDHDEDDVADDVVSPLRLNTAEGESASTGCNANATVLCISFSKK